MRRAILLPWLVATALAFRESNTMFMSSGDPGRATQAVPQQQQQQVSPSGQQAAAPRPGAVPELGFAAPPPPSSLPPLEPPQGPPSPDDTRLFYSDDWFTRHAPVWSAALSHLKGTPAQGLEIGAFQGMSTVWFMLNVLNHPDSSITCVDPFTMDVGELRKRYLPDGNPFDLWHSFSWNTRLFKNKVRVLRGSSHILLRALPSLPTFDFVYVDGDHAAWAALEDAVLAFRLLKVGGVMIFDDYGLTPGGEPTGLPKLAVDSFVAVYNPYLEILHVGYQVIIKKKKEAL